jgi:hypothetical protein
MKTKTQLSRSPSDPSDQAFSQKLSQSFLHRLPPLPYGVGGRPSIAVLFWSDLRANFRANFRADFRTDFRADFQADLRFILARFWD